MMEAQSNHIAAVARQLATTTEQTIQNSKPIEGVKQSNNASTVMLTTSTTLSTETPAAPSMANNRASRVAKENKN